MKPWVSLYHEHQGVRDGAGELATKGIRELLKKLAERGICDPSINSRFTYEKSRLKSLRTWRIMRAERGEPLRNLPHLDEARLTVLLSTSVQSHELHELTLMIDGRSKAGAPWCIAIHLPDNMQPDGDRQGAGACGHAALHCHVGATLDAEPKVRVPLPALAPEHALDWLLSQVVPDYEPAPWPAIAAALERHRKSSVPDQ
jgi:hypothetical protein